MAACLKNYWSGIKKRRARRPAVSTLQSTRNLSRTRPAQSGRREVTRLTFNTEGVRFALLIGQAKGQIATREKIVQHFDGVPGYLLIVELHAVGFSNTPELTTAIVMIDYRCLPGIFVDVEVTLGVDVAFTFFKGRAHVPHAVQLIASQILIDVACLDDLIVAETAINQLVGVVRNVHLFLANQFPVVTVRSAVEHVKVIGRTHAVSRGTRTIVSDLRGSTNATLAGVVDPGTTGLCNLVNGFVYQQHVTGQTCRRGNGLLEVEQHVVVLTFRVVREVGVPGQLILEFYNGVVTAGRRGDLPHVPLDGATTITGNVVPDRFKAVLWNRKRCSTFIVTQTVAILDQLHLGRVLYGLIHNFLWIGRRTMGLVNRNFVTRVLTNHRYLAWRKLVCVLINVALINHKLRSFIRVRVDVDAVTFITGRR